MSMQSVEDLTPEDIMALAQEPAATSWIHRYPHAPHTQGDDCWCNPLKLDHARVAQMTRSDVTYILREFFRVH